jgi:zinc-ribbon domain
MFCPQCGAENPADTTFCRQCGLSLIVIQTALEGRLDESLMRIEKSHKAIKVGSLLISIFSVMVWSVLLTALVNGTFSVGMLAMFLPGFIFGLPFVLFGTIKTNRAIAMLKTQIAATEPTQIGSVEKIRDFHLMQKAPQSITENTTKDLKSHLKNLNDSKVGK